MKTGELPQLVECLQAVPTEKGKHMVHLSPGWVILTAYQKCHEREEQKKLQLLQELAKLQGKLSMLQRQNFILGYQARNSQAVATKTAVRCAQYKHKKCRGKVNKKEVHAVIASAPLDWDPDKWGGDV